MNEYIKERAMSDIRAKKGGPTKRAPNHRSSPSGVAEVTKPASLIRQFIKDDPATAAAAALARVAVPKPRARCMNPACKKACMWAAKDRGRAPKFCSDACRLAFSRKRAALFDELDAYIELRALGTANRSQQIQLDRRISTLRMQLVRYPSD